MADTTIFVGLDVHKETIAVAMAPASPGAAFSYYGAIANTTEALRKLCKKLSADGETLEFCYEAGPWAMWYSGGSAVGAIGVMSWRPI